MKKKILLVDDDKDLLELIQFILEDKDYKVMLSDFKRIPADAVKFKPDLILLGDWRPGTGLDICKAVKNHQDTCHIPVVLISTSPSLMETASECGAESFIHKPFEINDLESVLWQTLHGHSN